jgi:hypothetical protein
MSIETARECFLDLMRRSQWTENVAGQISHTLEITDRDLAILADALGLDHRIYETTQSCIRRHIAAQMQDAAE